MDDQLKFGSIRSISYFKCHPFWVGIKLDAKLYGDSEGFPVSNGALFGLGW